MKKMTIIIIVVAVTGLAITVFAFNKINQKKKIQIAQINMEKYADYKYLREIEQTNKYRIIKYNDKFTGLLPDAPFFDQNNNVIFKLRNNDLNESEFTSTYYRLNRYGDIADTFLVNDYVE